MVLFFGLKIHFATNKQIQLSSIKNWHLSFAHYKSMEVDWIIPLRNLATSFKRESCINFRHCLAQCASQGVQPFSDLGIDCLCICEPPVSDRSPYNRWLFNV
jgi:hypothetical protein